MEMRLLKVRVSILLAILCAFSLTSSAAIITIGIEATVNNVTDPCNLLEGKVSVGSKITGTYTYDTSTPDTNPASETGDYVHYNLPYGIALTVGGIIFESDPQNTMFKIGITDALPGYLFNDSYGIRSFYNLPILDEVQVNELSWALVDTSNTALSNTLLTANAPHLADWNSDNTLYIGGGRGGIPPCYENTFYIHAEVISAVLIPEPTSLLFFGFGLLVLRKQKTTTR
ncbi:MAG: hypothetical protein ABSE89_02085 [Sedimentisphaerales bacterium]